MQMVVQWAMCIAVWLSSDEAAEWHVFGCRARLIANTRIQHAAAIVLSDKGDAGPPPSLLPPP